MPLRFPLLAMIVFAALTIVGFTVPRHPYAPFSPEDGGVRSAQFTPPLTLVLARAYPATTKAGRTAVRVALIVPMSFGTVRDTAFASPSPPLRNLVRVVICLSSEKKMGWINARRIVATVKHLQSVGDRPVVHLPGETVRFEHAPTGMLNRESAIPAASAGSPLPAIAGFPHLGPESFSGRRSHMRTIMTVET